MSPRTLTVVHDSVSDNGQKADEVGTLVPFCDYERELAIVRAGKLTEFFHAEYAAALADYERFGGFDAIGAAHRARANADCARRLMQALIGNRSAAQVARMEHERGLDLAGLRQRRGGARLNYDSEPVQALRLRLTSATSTEERKRLHSRIRAQRLAEAKARGTHTDEQWLELVARFDARCVRCGCTPDGRPCKDHILPIYMGGSDAIENLQPLCRQCNTAKGPDSTNWVEYREENWFLDIDCPEEKF